MNRPLIRNTPLLLLFAFLLPTSLLAAKPELKPYGFVRFETIYDQSEIAQGDWFLFAQPGGSAEDGQAVFTMSARHTRIGIKLNNPVVEGQYTVTGILEADFAGGFPNSTTAARQPILRLRHAWVSLSTPAWELKLGQDWTLLSAPFPNTANFVVGAGLGNLWMRLPQIRFTTKQLPVNVAVSLNRPMSANYKYNEFTSSDLDPVEGGELSALPWTMARAWYTMNGFTFSVFGHYGQEKLSDISAVSHTIATWSGNGSVEWKSGKWTATVKGFYGQDLNSFFGGVLQGAVVDSFTVDPITSFGGWGGIGYALTETWNLNLGGGLDDPNDDKLTTDQRARNSWIFANAQYSPVQNLRFIVEVDRLETDYIGKPRGSDLRTMFESVFNF